MSQFDPAEFARLGAEPQVCRPLLGKLGELLAGRSMRFMEVCGTHTVSIFQSGLASLLPDSVVHLSGPGCPVCVTHDSEIALLLDLARRKDVIIATFGDLLRVPGPDGLALRQIPGNNSRIVYSPLDCMALARANPDREVVFAAVGFETTAPAVAAAVISARQLGLKNFSVLALHKLIAPALKVLLSDPCARIDAFILPGHVATITGSDDFCFISRDYGKPAAVAGFEPADILLALCFLAEHFVADKPATENLYKRAVANKGNPRARSIMTEVFEKTDANWRGLGLIAESGLCLRPEFADFDASRKLDLNLPETAGRNGCICGAILKGKAQPPDCPAFGKKCQPAHPVGPCMVSTEGSCSAWYKYGGLPRPLGRI